MYHAPPVIVAPVRQPAYVQRVARTRQEVVPDIYDDNNVVPIKKTVEAKRQTIVDNGNVISNTVSKVETSSSYKSRLISTWDDLWNVFKTSEGTWIQLAYITLFVMAIRFVNARVSFRRTQAVKIKKNGTKTVESVNLLTDAATLHSYITTKATLGVCISLIALVMLYYTYFVWTPSMMISFQSNWFITLLCMSWVFVCTLPAMLSAVYRGEYLSTAFAIRRWLQMLVIFYTSKLELQYQLGFWTYGMIGALLLGWDLLFGKKSGKITSDFDTNYVVHDHGAFPRVFGLDTAAALMETLATVHDMYWAIVLTSTVGLITTLPLLVMNAGILLTSAAVELYEWIGSKIITADSTVVKVSDDGVAIVEKTTSVTTRRMYEEPDVIATTVPRTTVAPVSLASTLIPAYNHEIVTVANVPVVTEPPVVVATNHFGHGPVVVTKPSLFPGLNGSIDQWLQAGLTKFSNDVSMEVERRVRLAAYQWFQQLVVGVLKDQANQFGSNIRTEFENWVRQQQWTTGFPLLAGITSPPVVVPAPVVVPTPPVVVPVATNLRNAMLLSTNNTIVDTVAPFADNERDIRFWIERMNNLSPEDRKTIYLTWGTLYNQLKEQAASPLDWNLMTLGQQEQFLTYMRDLYDQLRVMASKL
jgi:hypothetical protein